MSLSGVAILLGVEAAVVLWVVRWQWGLAFVLGGALCLFYMTGALVLLSWNYRVLMTQALGVGLLLGALSGDRASQREPLWLATFVAIPQAMFAVLALASAGTAGLGDGRFFVSAGIVFAASGVSAYVGRHLVASVRQAAKRRWPGRER